MLLCPDKEAAFVFLFLGYYPIVKPRLDRTRLPLLWKLLLFNISIGVLYWLLLHVMGMSALQEEFAEMGTVMAVVLLLLGNITFFMLDYVLKMKLRRKKR